MSNHPNFITSQNLKYYLNWTSSFRDIGSWNLAFWQNKWAWLPICRPRYLANQWVDFDATGLIGKLICLDAGVHKMLILLWLSVLDEGRKCLFNDALNTFYLRLYGIRHMVKELSDSERGNPLPPYGLLFLINSKGSFICTIPQTGLHIPQRLLHQSKSTGCNEN